MDNWQKDIYSKLKRFAGIAADVAIVHDGNPKMLKINQAEAYILTKALESQQNYENPVLVIPNEEKS